MKKQRSIITKSLALLLCIALMMGNVCPCAVFGGEITAPEEIQEEVTEDTGETEDSEETGDVPTCEDAHEEAIDGIINTDETWSYVLDDKDEAVLVGYIGTEPEVEVPDRVDGRKVVSMRPGTFKGNKTVTKVSMPGTIDTLYEGSFDGCTALANVDMNGVTNLPEGLFSGNTSLYTVTFDRRITAVPANFCKDCTALHNVYFPAGLKSIGENAFNAGLPDAGTTHVYFGGTEEEWKKVSISAGNTALTNLNALLFRFEKSASIAKGNRKSGNWEYDIDEDDSATLKYYDGPRKKELTIPESIDDHKVRLLSHGDSSRLIDEKHAVSKVTVPEGVDIGFGFYGSSIDEAVLPNGLEEIGDEAFSGSGLKNIDLPGSLKKIGMYAFSSCGQLSALTIPVLVEDIDDHAFAYSALKELVIPGRVTTMGEEICGWCEDLEKLTLSEGITEIPEEAFRYTTGLKTIVFPSTLKTIGERAFAYCTSLTELTIPSTVTTIKSSAFSGCVRLKNMYITKGTTSIEPSAFGSGSMNVWYEGTQEEWNSICSGDLPAGIKLYCSRKSIGESESSFLFEKTGTYATLTGYYTSDNELTIPATAVISGETLPVKAIAAHVFEDNAGITSVTLPSSMATIGESAFEGCTALKTINLSGVSEIGKSAFYESGITSVEIGADSIGDYAFAYCSSLLNVQFTAAPSVIGDWIFNKDTGLTGVAFSSDFTAIGKYMFMGCSSLTDVPLPANLKNIGYMAFRDCDKLKEIEFPGSIESTGYGGFLSCDSLETVTFSGTVTNEEPFGEYVFSSCINLKSFTVPTGVKKIPDGMFYSSGLAQITIPASVTKIGQKAFYMCKDLTTINKIGTVVISEMGATAFGECTSLTNENVADILSMLNMNTLPNWTFSSCRFTEVTLVSKFKTIGGNAFDHCAHLSKVNLNGTEEIKGGAFKDCYSLSEIELPNTLTDLGGSAFNFSGLSHIVIPSGISALPGGTFGNCTHLCSVTLPSSITAIGTSDSKAVFNNCPKLKDIYYGGNESKKDTITIHDTRIVQPDVTWHYNTTADPNKYEGGFAYVNDANGVRIVRYVGTDGKMVIPATLGGKSIYKIDTGIFEGDESIKSVEMEVNDKLQSETGTLPSFKNCKNLKSVKITKYSGYCPALPAKAFQGCTSLEEVDLGKTIPGDYCFDGCVRLHDVKMNETTDVGTGAFRGCVSLEHIDLPDTINMEISAYMFEGCEALESIRIPQYAGMICGGAFKDCSNLRSIIVPSVSTVNDNAFLGCDKLKTVYTSWTEEKWNKYVTISDTGNASYKNAKRVYEYKGPQSFSFPEAKYELTEGGNVSSALGYIKPNAAELTGIVYKADSGIVEVKADETDPSKFVITAKEAGITRITASCGAANASAYVYVNYATPTPVLDGGYLTGLVPEAKYRLDGKLSWYMEPMADEDGRIELFDWKGNSPYYLEYEKSHSIVRLYEDNESCNSAVGTFTVGKKPDKPEAPELLEKTDTSLTIKKLDGYEYTIDNGVTLSETAVFEELLPGTAYSIGCRIKKNGSTEASGWRYATFMTEGKRPPRPVPDPEPEPVPSVITVTPAESAYWDVKAAEGNIVTWTPKTAFKDAKGNEVAFEVKTTIAVDYTGKSHVLKSAAQKKKTSNDIEFEVNSPVTGLAKVSVKYKNNKIVPVKAGKEPRFTISLKANKGITKDEKKLVKAITKELKKKPIPFKIEKADITGQDAEIKLNKKKTKVTKVTVTINGVAIKMTKKDYEYKIEDGKVTITGAGNFKGLIEKAL